MADYTYDSELVADPFSFQRAANATITVYDSNDTSETTPLVLKDLTGLPLPNPLASNADAFVPAFIAPSSQVKMVGGGLRVVRASFQGVRDEAVEAKLSAAESQLAAQSAAALVGAPADTAIAAAVSGANSSTRAALNATFVPKWKPNTAYVAGDAVLSPAGDTVTAKVNFTSGVSYSAANWNVSPTYAAKSAETTAIAAQASATSARVLARRGFPNRPTPVKSMWFNAGVSGHGIVTFQAAGTTFELNDTADYALGDRSARVTTNGTGGFTIMQKSGLTIDATGQNVRIWLKVDDVSKLGNLDLFLGDNTFTSYFQASIFTAQPENKSTIKSGEWVAFDVPWSAFTTTVGTPNRAAIQLVRLNVSDTNTGSPAVVRWNGVAGIAENTTFPNGVVSLTFDDCYTSTYSIARPYMDKYGYAGTLYPIVEAFSTAGRLTLANAKKLEQANGWDFGFHAMTFASHNAGFDTLSQDALVAEYENMLAWGSDNDVRGDSLAWPLTTSSKLSEKTAANYFSTARGGIERLSETLPPSQRMNLRTIGVNATKTLASLQAHVDKAKVSKTWAVFTFHDIVAASATGNDTTTAIFQGLIDYINAQGVAVRTVSQVMKSV